MRRGPLLIAMLLLCGCGTDERPAAALTSNEIHADQPHETKAEPVGLNPDVTLTPGFRGEVHPLLSGTTRLELTAEWTPVPTGRARELGYFPDPFYEPFRGLAVAERSHVYTGRDFSGFLPETVDALGQLWAIDLDRSLRFLRQFHPSASTKLEATGRRAGPNGGFAALRAISPTHLEIVFRLHAEFPLEPGVFYTPAHFSGEMLVNHKAGVVEAFRLAAATGPTLNATLTVVLPTEALLDIVRVERMELVGAPTAEAITPAWTSEIARSAADEALKRVFFKFYDIDWVPPEEALARARELNRPILALVLWGALDEQSC